MSARSGMSTIAQTLETSTTLFQVNYEPSNHLTDIRLTTGIDLDVVMLSIDYTNSSVLLPNYTNAKASTTLFQ
jgi:hypothetical protein